MHFKVVHHLAITLTLHFANQSKYGIPLTVNIFLMALRRKMTLVNTILEFLTDTEKGFVPLIKFRSIIFAALCYFYLANRKSI